MSDLSDYQYQEDSAPSSPPSSPPPANPTTPSRTRLIAAVVVTVLIVLALGYVFFLRNRNQIPAEVADSAPVAPTGATVVKDTSPAVPLPPLDDTDTLVRDLARALSDHPRAAAWLATDGLIRNFVVVVENASNGQTPAQHLRMWQPSPDFAVVGSGAGAVIDPASYRRYDDVTAAITDLDPNAVAELYEMLRPRMNDAYRELGYQQSFDVALERAIVLLLETPIRDGTVEVDGALYAFADIRLESLAPAQKQLLRMGPSNARAVQGTLRAVGGALGFEGVSAVSP